MNQPIASLLPKFIDIEKDEAERRNADSLKPVLWLSWLERHTDNVEVGSSSLPGTTSDSDNGGLAQLARALALQARGHRFDSDILH